MHPAANTIDNQDGTTTVVPTWTTTENWEQQYLADPYFANAIKYLQGDTDVILSSKEAERSTYWHFENGKITVQFPGGTSRLAVPRGKHKQIQQDYHGSHIAGHPGVNAMTKMIAAIYFWPRIGGSCASYIRNCDTCLRSKVRNTQHGTMQPLAPPTGQWQMLDVSFITGLPNSNGYDNIVTFTDRYTKRAHLAACKITDTAEDFANMYIDVIVRHHGVVPLVLSDRDAKFAANFWRHLTARLGTILTYATTDHQHTVELVARPNRTATEAIRTLIFSHPEDWSKCLAIVEYTLNNTAHSST